MILNIIKTHEINLNETKVNKTNNNLTENKVQVETNKDENWDNDSKKSELFFESEELIFHLRKKKKFLKNFRNKKKSNSSKLYNFFLKNSTSSICDIELPPGRVVI